MLAGSGKVADHQNQVCRNYTLTSYSNVKKCALGSKALAIRYGTMTRRVVWPLLKREFASKQGSMHGLKEDKRAPKKFKVDK